MPENGSISINSPMESIVSENGEVIEPCLEIILARYMEKEKVTIVKSKIEPAAARGTNFISNAWRVTFDYTINDENEVKSDAVVVKTRSGTAEFQKMMQTSTAFANEIFAYEHILPTLSSYVTVKLRVPQFYHGNENSIVLEDMNLRSFKSINTKLAKEWPPIWSPLQEMAKLHAASIVMKKMDPEKFDALINSIVKVPLEETKALGALQRDSVRTVIKVLEEAETDEAKTLKNHLFQISDETWEKQRKIAEEDVPIRVINHGSIWTNNMLYRNNVVTLIDWQQIAYSSPAYDLSFFMYVNVDTDFLMYNKQRIIDFYLVNLQQFIYDACINKLSAEEVQEMLEPLNKRWMESELRRFGVYGYMMAQWVTPTFFWSDAVLQAIIDLGGIETMTMEDRMKYMTSEQRDRLIKLTKFYFDNCVFEL